MCVSACVCMRVCVPLCVRVYYAAIANDWRTDRFFVLSHMADYGVSGGPVVSQHDGKVVGMVAAAYSGPQAEGNVAWALKTAFISEAVIQAAKMGPSP